MATQKRAYSDEEKQQREQMIIDAAGQLFMEKSFHTINMSEIARKANLAKGTVYLYFQTKEELFLMLFEQQFEQWLEIIASKIRALSPPVEKSRIVDILVETTVANRQLVRLAALSSLIFEHNITYEKAVEYKYWLFEQVQSLGTQIEAVLNLQPSQGTTLLYRLYIIVIGLENIANPAPVTQKVYENHTSLPHPDFETELHALVTLLVHAFDD